ncbi:MAG: macrolide ABC transporter ATP-binding protein [Candidatus Buchananbacteria bacterium RIFCSPHIGHO2_02_FULL_40_13]|uniref:Macrolide ABC transporter ATP-binding protein n=1 Tax=Candidatus Buchananbacteria bacterium RIFCSPLOWO2_01_FULL_39_33 TaxID=1797543 RepID=A0A1G1YH73_9BACT|nr:MAG: macrolide ABC transporter ATP-binding protein [Candidatus Buchananbacteria bacterium RIFCSPHIGHO2_01_FULL_40_35]OGY50463.1 MAG: macrolide ABC transporter ATP-binding protein [Candidatus Buchananbacteria bacterium RIFCSPHIGHO2_02_FULL_40_13]OGY51604.1 MAG: macrolide ABC transporter ATP-binding protein [Candidatus Buchananbacteria bacterium RIFCSPLOWO2_01_FULL_39_33]
MSQDIIIKVENLKKDYVNDEIVTEVLDNLNFEVAKGEFLAIMGPSGSGKSTLMHLLGFLDTPTSGRYIFKGNDVSNLSDDELAKIRNEEVGFVFQTFNLLPKTTVFDNVKLPLLYSRLKDRDRRVTEAITAVGLLHRLNNLSNQLSGGERQRVAIARALVTNPSVIFADEPTGNLDTKSGQVIMGILEKLNNEGHTIILVTHEQYTAQHAQRIIKIIDGQIVSDEKVSARRSSLNGNDIFLK